MKNNEKRIADALGTLTIEADAFVSAKDFWYDTRSALVLTHVGEGAVKETAAKLSRLIGEAAPVVCDGKERTAATLCACERAAVPPLSFKDKRRHDFADLVNIMRRLCADDGCEWDKAQTHDSIRANAVEEAYELVEAIDNRDVANMREECGDVMLQSVFHCEIAEKNGEFDLSDMLTDLGEKLITRHPHVFGDVVANSAEESLASWEAAKAKEKGAYRASDKMKRVAKALPAVERGRDGGVPRRKGRDRARDRVRRPAVRRGQRRQAAQMRSRDRAVEGGAQVREQVRRARTARGKARERAVAKGGGRTLGRGEKT